jgi:hypothetical protein
MRQKNNKTEIHNGKLLIDYTNPESVLLTREELAGRWKYCTETLKRWEKSGRIPFIKLGKEIRYRLSSIQEIELRSEVLL